MSEQAEFWKSPKPSPAQIVCSALTEHSPVATFALFSGGDGSLHAAHWAMNNIENCQVAHINTGIGIERTRQFVRETCEREGWPLTEIRAKEDCGQDYDEIVRQHGFPGPAAHRFMYVRLKERAIEELIRRNKSNRLDRIMLLTGVKHDDSKRRSGYGGRAITRKGAQVWVNHMYWADRSETYHYIKHHNLPRNPVAEEIGMSGECACGAFASKGELAIWSRADSALGRRICALQEEARSQGVHCNWETPPPANVDKDTGDLFAPLCSNCINHPHPR